MIFCTREPNCLATKAREFATRRRPSIFPLGRCRNPLHPRPWSPGPRARACVLGHGLAASGARCARTLPRMHSLRRALRFLFGTLAALLLLFEEWGWEPLAALLARLGRLPVFAWLERRIAALPPWAALLVFFVPMLALLPIKLLAVYLFGTGHVRAGLALLLAAKLAGTALVARLFTLTQPQLMRLRWFADWYPRFKAWKDALFDRVRQTAVWRAGRHFKRRAKARWSALRRRLRNTAD